jgi:hypothetical protein
MRSFDPTTRRLAGEALRRPGAFAMGAPDEVVAGVSVHAPNVALTGAMRPYGARRRRTEDEEARGPYVLALIGLGLLAVVALGWLARRG